MGRDDTRNGFGLHNPVLGRVHFRCFNFALGFLVGRGRCLVRFDLIRRDRFGLIHVRFRARLLWNGYVHGRLFRRFRLFCRTFRRL